MFKYTMLIVRVHTTNCTAILRSGRCHLSHHKVILATHIIYYEVVSSDVNLHTPDDKMGSQLAAAAIYYHLSLGNVGTSVQLLLHPITIQLATIII